MTQRDEEIILSLYRFRFLDSTQIQKLLNDQSQWLIRRLRMLYDHGYIDRPANQLMRGNRPMIYAIGNKAIPILKDKYVLPMGNRWALKNRLVGQFQLEHTLSISDQLIAFNTACRKRDDVKFLDERFLIDQIPRSKNKLGPLLLQAKITWDGKRETTSLVPDGFFGLFFTDLPESRQTAYFMLETDKGHMPIVRRQFRQTSILKKMLSYTDYIQNKRHTEQFGIKAFRVLFVTTSRQRIKTMQACYKNHLRRTGLSPGFFLFATEDDVKNSDPLELIWETASGKEVTLMPEPQNKPQTDGIIELLSQNERRTL